MTYDTKPVWDGSPPLPPTPSPQRSGGARQPAPLVPLLPSFPNSGLGTAVCETLFRRDCQTGVAPVPKQEFGNEGSGVFSPALLLGGGGGFLEALTCAGRVPGAAPRQPAPAGRRGRGRS